jgi:hypothetical protein
MTKPSLFARAGLTTASLLVAGLWLATPAGASVITFTFQEKVTAFTDVDDVYGLGLGANLTGDTVTDVYTLDTSTLTYETGGIAGDAGSILNEYDGPLTGADSVTSTIDGHTVTINSANGAYIGAAVRQLYAPNPYDQEILDLTAVALETTGTAIGSEFLFRDVAVSYSTTGLPPSLVSPTGGLTLSPAALNAAGGNWASSGVYYPFAAGSSPGFFSVPEGTIAGYTAPIPEPSSWALMLVGVGMLGGGLRRGRSKNGRTPLAA